MPTPLHVILEGDVRQAWRNVVLAFSYCEGGRREEYGEGEEGTRRGEEGEGMKKEEGTREGRDGRKLNVRTANVQSCSPHTPVVL